MATTFGRLHSKDITFQDNGTLWSKYEVTDIGVGTFSSGVSPESPGNTVELRGLTDPSQDDAAATKKYVDDLLEGIIWKAAVVVATDVAGDLAADFSAGAEINGYTLVVGDRILIKDQLDGYQNGIYVVNSGAPPTRATDMAAGSSAHGDAVYAIGGTVCGGCSFICVSPVGSDTVGDTAGSDPIIFTIFASPSQYTPGVGINITGLTISTDGVVFDYGPQDITGEKTFTDPTFVASLSTLGGGAILTGTTLSGVTAVQGLNAPSINTDAANKDICR